MNSLWSEQEIESLKKMERSGVDRKAMAERLGRSIQSVQCQIKALRAQGEDFAPRRVTGQAA